MKGVWQNVRFKVSFVRKDFGRDGTLIDCEHTKSYEGLVEIPIPDEYLEILDQLGKIMVYNTDKKNDLKIGMPGIRIQGDFCQTVYLEDLALLKSGAKLKK